MGGGGGGGGGANLGRGGGRALVGAQSHTHARASDMGGYWLAGGRGRGACGASSPPPQSQEKDSAGGGAACIDLLNRMWDCETKRRITCKEAPTLFHALVSRSRSLPLSLSVCMYVCIIYIYIYI